MPKPRRQYALYLIRLTMVGIVITVMKRVIVMLTPKGRQNPMIHATPKRPRRAAQSSTVLSARNMGACTLHTTTKIAGATTKTEAPRRQAGCPNPTNLQVERMG